MAARELVRNIHTAGRNPAVRELNRNIHMVSRDIARLVSQDMVRRAGMVTVRIPGRAIRQRGISRRIILTGMK